jgi:hypothetical protein
MPDHIRMSSPEKPVAMEPEVLRGGCADGVDSADEMCRLAEWPEDAVKRRA